MQKPRLSTRERDELELASAGLTNHQVAEQFGLSVHGVKFHLASVYRKLGASNRTAAARVFLEQGSPAQASAPEVALL